MLHDGASAATAGWELALVEQARAGDEGAFEALVRTHQDRAYGIALRMTRRPEDAQDVLQEALVAAWQALPGFRGDSSFETWLIRMVINRCHNLRRDRRPAAQLPEHGLVDPAPQPESVTEARRHRDAAVEAIAALPFDQRAALVLHTFGGYPHAEVAVILGTSEAATKVRVHRARRALLDRLRDWR